MRAAAIVSSLLALGVPAARAADAPLTPARARVAASARLLRYALRFSYVVDYGVTRCAVSGTHASCAFRIAWYQEPTCTGTIAVTAHRHVLATRFAAPLCAPPPEATAATSPPATAPVPQPGAPPSPPEPGTHVIDSIADDYSVVTLDDGSTWAIGADDQPEVGDWVAGDEVDVAQLAASTYSLTDDTLGDGVAVTATYAGTG